MDSSDKQNSLEKSQSKKTSGSSKKTHSPRSRDSNRQNNSNHSQSGKGNTNNKRYKSKPVYRQNHHNLSHYKRKQNYNPTYNSNWNRPNSRSNNNGRWNSSAPRYGNLKWQRNNLDHSIPNQSNSPQGQYYGENHNDFFARQPNPGSQELLDLLQGHLARAFENRFCDQNFSEQSQGAHETFTTRNPNYNQEHFAGDNFFEEPNNILHKDTSPNQHKKADNKISKNQNKEETQKGSNYCNQNKNSFANVPQDNNRLRDPETECKEDDREQTQSDLQPPWCPETENQGGCIENEAHKEVSFAESFTEPACQSQGDICKPFESKFDYQNQEKFEPHFDNLPPKDLQEPEQTLETSELILNIKPEPQDACDSDLDLSNCLNVDNRFPSISVVPLFKLIKNELQDLNRFDIVAPTTPPRGRPTLRPNLVKRRKKSINECDFASLSENLVQRVANMDKVGIKNVINNSGTKYDAALKIQARKRLREEIRKQLKSMNFTPNENSENCILVPDEIVDSMHIPAVVLDEIRKAFGIVLVEDKRFSAESEKPSSPVAMESSSSPAAQVQSKTPPPTQPAERPSKSPDLMSRLKMLEEIKSQSEKLSPERPATVMPKERSKKKTNDDVVVINSSSSSSSSSSSDSDSDSSSSSSNASTTSSFKRRRRKKRILEANVVGNFEKLILPNLTHAQRRRYKEKYSKSTKGSLLYIYGVCVSRANQQNSTLDPKEKLKLKQNLSTADNAQSLEFLMKAILNVFEQQKANRVKGKAKSASTATKKSASGSNHSNPITDSTRSQRNSDDDEPAMVKQSESANAAQSAELPKHQSKKVNKASQPPPSKSAKDANIVNDLNVANSAQGMLAGGEIVSQHSDSESDLGEYTESGSVPCSSSSSRVWKSPGEKKCIDIEIASPMLSNLGMLQSPLGNHSLDMDSLKSHVAIGNEAVSNIREIDVKLMELHKRKMYIEEMILKLQKDKMEVDLYTMKLQNEKFILLNSALANASSSSNTALALDIPKIEKKAKPTAKRKPFSTPFSEKLRNRKKRCQRDILLEDTEKAINVNKTKDEAADISKLMLLPRQTRRSTKNASEKGAGKNSESPMSAIEANKTENEIKAKTDEAEEEQIVKVVPQVDYTDVPNGNLEGWKLPITQIVVAGEAIVAASEDGNIYKFNIRTRVLESKFSKHTEAITQIFTCPRENFVYTTSLDGFLKKTSIENFGLEIQSLNLQEPLQSIDIEWGTAFIGSRWGNIFTYDIKNNKLSESLLCSSKSSIIAIKATKEGPRKILIVSSKGNQIHFRDAMSGLLLRSLDISDNLHIYSILLDGGCIYCGTQRNEIHQYNFTTGERLAIFQCGNGAVSMKLYKDKYIFVGCYDGFVYVLDKTTGCQIGRFPGSGKMILALEIAGDKLITSAKDNTMQITDIPKYIVTKEKS